MPPAATASTPQLTARPLPATAEPRHQPELDGIRGLAILAVLLSHAADALGVLPHHTPHAKWVSLVAFALVPGWGGVDLFFVLSGFLITGILLRSRSRPTYFRSFYARRVLRIFPIYYLFLLATLLAAHVSPGLRARLPATPREILSYFLYLQNWPLFWPNLLGMTTLWGSFWSLAVEEQFYLVWPAAVRLLSVPTMLALCCAGFLLGTPVRWALIHWYTGIHVSIVQMPVTRLDGLFLGAACALYRQHRGRPVPLHWAAWSFAAGAVMMLQIAVFHVRELFGIDLHIATYGIAAFALMATGLVAASQHRLPWLDRILVARPLRVAGRYSYGMYVYHLLIYAGLTWLARRIAPATGGEFNVFAALLYIALAILLVTAVAAASFHLIETPFLRLKRFFPSPPPPVSQTS
jgi:peptidoglycan/LPS O-acetylase OafA/YrhL